jgi:hypothetical protein
MNNLIWLLYAADVAGSVSGVLSFIAFGAVVACAGSCSFYFMLGGSPTVYSWDDRTKVVADHNATRGTLKKVPKSAAIVFLIATTLASIIPGKETIYAIAAIEMGENVLNSQTGDKAVKALNAWLDRQIAEEK